MKFDDAQLLLGGYATGTLSEEERKVLFQAALEDQQLFDALADEEALRELLADPAARRRMAAILARPSARQHGRGAWYSWFWRPIPAGALAVFAVTVIGVSLFLQKQNAEFDQLAEVRTYQTDSGTAVGGAVPEPKVEDSRGPDRRAENQPLTSESGRANRIVSSPSAQTVRTAPAPAAPPAAAEPPAPSRDIADLAPEGPALAASPQFEDAVKKESRADAEAEKTDARQLAARAPAAPPPFRHWIERRQSDGSWAEFGAELSAGDAVRLRVVPNQDGYLMLEGAEDRAIQAATGGTYYLPVTSEAGARVVTVTLSTRMPAGAGTGVGAAFSTGELSRLRKAAPVKALPEAREEKSKAAAAGELAPPAGYSVSIRLQFR